MFEIRVIDSMQGRKRLFPCPLKIEKKMAKFLKFWGFWLFLAFIGDFWRFLAIFSDFWWFLAFFWSFPWNTFLWFSPHLIFFNVTPLILCATFEQEGLFVLAFVLGLLLGLLLVSYGVWLDTLYNWLTDFAFLRFSLMLLYCLSPPYSPDDVISMEERFELTEVVFVEVLVVKLTPCWAPVDSPTIALTGLCLL